MRKLSKQIILFYLGFKIIDDLYIIYSPQIMNVIFTGKLIKGLRKLLCNSSFLYFVFSLLFYPMYLPNAYGNYVKRFWKGKGKTTG